MMPSDGRKNDDNVLALYKDASFFGHLRHPFCLKYVFGNSVGLHKRESSVEM